MGVRRGEGLANWFLSWDEGEALDGDLCAAARTLPGGQEDYGDLIKLMDRR